MIITHISDYPALLINPDAESIQEVLGHRAGGTDNHSLAIITIHPGKASKPHYHKILSESYLILEGIGSLEVDGKCFDLKPREAVLIQPMEIHQLHNHGQENLVFMAVCVPAWSPEDSFDIVE